jgi:hypothetical protein
MPKFIKGSQEAKDHMAKIREAKKSGNKKPPNPNKGIRKKNSTTKVELPMVNQSSIAVPEFFANKNVNKKGKITYRLVNPLTKTRNLSKRNGETSIKIIRKPIENMVIMEHQTEPIPLSLFSKKDREIIDTHFKVVSEHKGKEILEVPHSKPFQNKERGRPEKLPKNIEVNKQRKGQKKQNIQIQIKKKEPENITMNIDEDSDNESEKAEEQPKPKRKNKKYASEEERKEAIKQQKRESAKRIRDAKKGKGIFTGLTNFTNKVINKVSDYGKKTISKVEKFGDALLYGRNDYPPKVRNILDKYGNKIVRGITIGRTPVPQLLTGALSVASGGDFGKNLKNSPYDTLFHLFIRVSLDDGSVVSMEKNEVINMDIDPAIPANTETRVVSKIPENLTPLTILDNAKRVMGGSFFKYSARDNNCQDFIMALFNGSNIGDEEDRTFIKQNTKSLFEGLTGLRKFSNTITDIGGRFNVLTQGAGIEKDSDKSNSDYGSDGYDSDYDTGKGIGDNYIVQSVIFDKSTHNIKQAKKWLKDNGYKSPKVDEETNTIRFRQLDPKKMEKQGYTKYRNKKLGNSGITLVISYMDKKNISNNNIMPKFAKGSKEAKEHMARIRSMKGKSVGGAMVRMPDGSFKGVGSDALPDSKFFRMKPLGSDPRTYTPNHSGSDSADALHKANTGSGLYAGGSQPSGGSIGSVIDDAVNQSRHLIGLGVPPPSRSYGSVLGFGVHHHHHYHIQGDGFFDDIGRAFDPKQNGVAKAFDPNQNGVAKAFEPVKDVAVKTFTPQLGRDITSGLIHQALPAVVSGLAGSATTALTGNPYAGFAVGQTLGKYAGKQAGDAVGNATGYGFKKGSQEAKDHMAKIRAMKGKKKGGAIVVGKVY